MSSTFGGLEIAKSGISVSMLEMNLTEQNISNANNTSYTRQRLLTNAKEMGASYHLITPAMITDIGDGVDATGVEQIRSDYLDQQYRDLNSQYNYSNSNESSFTYLTGLLNETNQDAGIKTAITSFFSALKTFASDTTSKSGRTAVQQSALSMTQSFNGVYNEMQSLWTDQNTNINTIAQNVNSLATKIAQLNDSIANCVQSGASANTLIDERNEDLDTLSGYVNINYSVNSVNKNMVDVNIGGVSLVSGQSANAISVNSAADHAADINTWTSTAATYNSSPSTYASQLDTLYAQLNAVPNLTVTQAADHSISVTMGGVSLLSGVTAVSVSDAVSGSLDASIALNAKSLTLNNHELSIANKTITGGQLYSSIEMTTSESANSPGIPYYMSQLNTLVQTIAKNMNTINESGWTYPDSTNANTSAQNVDLFNVPGNGYGAITAGNFTISSDLSKSVYNIAGSSKQIDLTASAGSTQAGNNDVASELYADLTNSGYYDKMDSIVSNLSITANTCASVTSTRNSLTKSVNTQRTSLSGVSTTEEAANMIVYQQSYNACARVMTAMSDMLDTLINNMGVS